MARRSFLPPAAVWHKLAEEFDAAPSASPAGELPVKLDPHEMRAAKLLSSAFEAGAELPGVELPDEIIKGLCRAFDAAEAKARSPLQSRHTTGLSIGSGESPESTPEAMSVFFWAGLTWFLCVRRLGEAFPSAFRGAVESALMPPKEHWPDDVKHHQWAERARAMADACRLLPDVLQPAVNEPEGVGNDEAQQDSSGYKARASRDARRLAREQVVVQACQLKREHPEWTNAQIARAIKRHPSFLSKSPGYVDFCARLKRGTGVPRGYYRNLGDGSRDLEAYDD